LGGVPDPAVAIVFGLAMADLKTATANLA